MVLRGSTSGFEGVFSMNPDEIFFFNASCVVHFEVFLMFYASSRFGIWIGGAQMFNLFSFN